MLAALSAASVYISLGEFAPAREVLGPFEETGSVRVLYVLAWLDSRLGDRERALVEYRRAFESACRVKDVEARAQAATHFSYELYQATKYEEAVRVLDLLLREPAGTIPIDYERDARLNLARALNNMGDPPAAEAEFRRLKDLLGTAPLSASELLLDARLHVESGQLRSADGLLEQARTVAREANWSRYLEGAAVMNRIEIAVKEADWDRLHALLKEMQPFREKLVQDDQRDLAWLEGIGARGEGNFPEALKLLEQAKALSPPANVLWEIDDDMGLTFKGLGRGDEARAAFEESISEVEAQETQLANPGSQATLMVSRQRPFDELFDLFAESGDAEGALSTLQRSLSSRLVAAVAAASSSAGHEIGDALERSAARRKLTEASRALPEQPRGASSQNARFVAFVTTETHSWALVHAGGRASVERMDVPPGELCTLMQRFGEDLDDGVARRLGAALFPPARLAHLGTRFAIILPTCARNFPVAAVRVGDGRLVDRAVVSVAPNVATVSWPGHGAAGSSRACLVLADPFGDLPSAREEADWARKATGADVRMGKLALGKNLEPSGGRLLHFATHTAVDVSGPALVLADGKLSVSDILRVRLHADLVVLAGCHSGSRLAATASETLSTAFLRVGSGAVLATWRSVEDRFAAEVIRAFYEEGGLDDPAAALTRVQRRLARTETPEQWAAFFVAGSPEPLIRKAVGLRRAQAFAR